MLQFGAPPAVTPEAFLASCRDQLSARDAAAVESLLTDAPSDHPFVSLWRDREAILRNAAARERARTAGSDPARWVRPVEGCDLRLEHLTEAALQERDPLARERALDRARWTVADELGGPDPLARERIFVYAVQLAIATRWQARDAERGRASFATLTQESITL